MYNANRMYFGNWKATMLDDIFHNTSGGNRPEEIYIGKLTEDIICDTLWYEMSYNPVRFGTVSPFKNNGKNDISYFLDTYRKQAPRDSNGLLPDEIMTLVWQIGDFMKNLKKTNFYDNFRKTGTLPNALSILGADTNYYILSSLRKAIHAIAKQNWQDLRNPAHKDKIIQIATHRHPSGKRSDINYIAVKAAFEQKAPVKTKQQNAVPQKNKKVVQMCLPFFKKEKLDTLAVIRGKIIQKKDEIAILEQQIKDLHEIENVDVKNLYKDLKHLKLQYASLCGQEKKLLNKIRASELKQNLGR